MRRAKDRLGIKPYKERGKEHGGWLWFLSHGGHSSDQHAHVRKLDTMDTLDTIDGHDSQDGQDGQDLDVGSLSEGVAALDGAKPNGDYPDIPAFLDRRSRA